MAREPVPKPLDIPNSAEMLPLAEWEALDFLIADEAIRPEAAKLLFGQLSQGMGRRVGNPQLLAVARRLWREGARVPNTWTEIFQAFFKVAGASLSSDSRESLLPQLAFFMSKRDRLSLSKEHLEDEAKPKGLSSLAQEVAFRTIGANSADELLSEVEKTRLLRGPRAFTFPNIAFQEFLTAYSLRFAPPTTIMSLLPPADWRELGLEFGRPVNLSRGPFHGAMPYLCGLRHDGPDLVEMVVGGISFWLRHASAKRDSRRRLTSCFAPPSREHSNRATSSNNGSPASASRREVTAGRSTGSSP